MNFISCMVRILEIPSIRLIQNQIPVAMLRVEIAHDLISHTSIIVEAEIWGNLTYDIEKYYRINDYLLIEGYFSTCMENYSKNNSTSNKVAQLTIYQIYPFFFF